MGEARTVRRIRPDDDDDDDDDTSPPSRGRLRKKQAQENHATGGEGVTNHCRQQGGGPNRDRIDR